MNSVLADPDVKINMSLDEIIQLTRGDAQNEMQGRKIRNIRNKCWKRMNTVTERSSPLVSFPPGSSVYEEKKCLSFENKRRIAQLVSNRGINSELLKKTKEIIPAEYKLIKTAYGVERVLVPATDYVLDPKKKVFPRKPNMRFPCNSPSPELHSQLPDKPPPLIAASMYRGPESTVPLAEPEDEIVVLDCPNSKKLEKEVIDVESNLPEDVMEIKKLFMPGVSVMPQNNKIKTLNDRFTLLAENSQF